MSFPVLAEKLPRHRRQAWEDDYQLIIVRGAGNFQAEKVELTGTKVTVSGYAIDQEHGLEMITEYYDTKEVVEFYLM